MHECERCKLRLLSLFERKGHEKLYIAKNDRKELRFVKAVLLCDEGWKEE
jgi:hypothetical protein